MDSNNVCPICNSYMLVSLEHKTWLKCNCGFSKPTKEFITLHDYWMGRDLQYPDDLHIEIRHNAANLLSKVNGLLNDLEVLCMTSLDGKLKISSGWRPLQVNLRIANASKDSPHISGRAVDIQDVNNILYTMIDNNIHLLKDYNLWRENKNKTKSWIHLDIKSRTEREDRTFQA